MLMVDLHNSRARLSISDITSPENRRGFGHDAFSTFWSGLSLGPHCLLEQSWRFSGSASSSFAYFRSFMHQTLPANYDVTHLDKLGGRFRLRITGVGGFTVMTLLGRIVTLSGLPIDHVTGEPVIDAELSADVFMALCNGLLADLAEKTLAGVDASTAGSG